MAFENRDRHIDLRFFRHNDVSGKAGHSHMRVVMPCIGNVPLSSSVGMQTAAEKDKEANDVLGGAFKARRIGKLKERVLQASGGEFMGFADDDNEIIRCLKLHGDIRCLSASGVPHLYSDSQGWRVSPLYLQNAAKWQYEYEPVIQRACIEASANGLETVRINTDTGEIDGSDFALQPIAGMENIIRRVVSGDIVVENGTNQLVLRWDEYPDE